MPIKQSVFRMTLHSNPKQVSRVEGFLNKVNRIAHLNEIQFHKLMVSLTEAVNNAIIHGNKSDEAKRVKVTCELMPGWLLMLVHDEGKGFKPNKVRSPLKDKNLLLESGRGIFLMRTLMDKVVFEFSRTGSEVQLWLDLKK